MEKCGGKLVFTDFSKLNPKEFYTVAETPEEMQEQSAAIQFDGKIYVNSSKENGKAIADAFSHVIVLNRSELRKIKKHYDRKYPKIKNLSDYEKMQGNEKGKAEALAKCIVNIEIDRRKVESEYLLKV